MAQVVGRLADGTPHYAPVGVLLAEDDRVCCHLCGRWFLSVASHLRYHGWTKTAYIAAFGLELGNPLSGPATSKRRSEALGARHAEPAIVGARLAARERAGNGALTEAAARAAQGRPHPAERRAKTLAALAGVDPAARAEGNRRRAEGNRRRGERHRERIATEVAARFGFATFEEYLAARVRAGLSMAAISREAGLHKDWVCRHAPVTQRPAPGEARLGPVARALGHAGVGAYLRAVHIEQHRTVAAIALEAGVSRWTVLAALRHHGIEPAAHAAMRHAAEARGRSAARALGFASIGAFVAARRAEGAPWSALAAESGIAPTSLRRYQKRDIGDS
ncbi:MucR family transcriptional regulator [Dactylosporangium sp. NPDC000555]|uniref:MucR family transcriptional regulator n=1 Tax=Dactylosporangium sp. NPDC000555 TaxID=3154260 RepID=UPI00333085DE